MFRRIVVDNFKSFKHAEFNLTEGNIGRANNMALLFGANGGGKSNIMYSIIFLKESLKTLADRGVDVRQMAEVSRNWGSDGNMSMEYSFSNGAEDGEYLLEFDSENRLVREKLDYTINKNPGNIFDIRIEDGMRMCEFSRQLFKTALFRDIMENDIEKWWGDHTFLSIIFKQASESRKEYLSEMLGTGILGVVKYIDDIQVCRPGMDNMGCGLFKYDPFEGVVPRGDARSIEKFADVAGFFISSTYDDIVGIDLESWIDGNMMHYRMNVVREFDGERYVCPAKKECTGVKEALRILPALMCCANGGTALVDNIEFGLHEAVLKNIFDNCLAGISGQLITASTATILLENSNPHHVFVVKDGTVTPFPQIERTQKNHNNRNRYLKGVFGALPEPAPVDLCELSEQFMK